KTDAVIFDPALTGYMEKLKASGHDLTFICMEEKEGYLSVPELLKKGYELPEEDVAAYRALPVDGNALSIILFTSGTTSLSKAVMLSQFNITHNCWSVSSAEDLRTGDVNMAFLPYHHTFGSTGQTMMSYVGMTTVFCDGLKYIQKNICEYGVSVFICVPLLIESIHKRIMSEIKRQGKDKTFAKGVKISRFLRKRGIDLRRRLFKDVHEKLGGKLRYIISGASPLDPVVAESFTDMGIQVVQGYGMTEASPVIAAENIPNLRFGTVGKAIPGVDVMIEDPNEEGIGEIIVRGPNVMMGYYEDEEDTEAIMGDGWLHTGDLASMDSDGFVTIRGRKKNVIVLKNGKNVYPEEIETLINNLPYVSECMVFGEPKREDDPTDLILSVRIVYNPEAAKELYEADTKEAIEKLASHDIESLNAELPAYKHIYRKYITDEPMEKTTTGKVKRYKQI
ncbi:MAG: AMP-binding protein, partial [Firmicutes bacterium]|nr:AMP-binding protein [Bacillota bacterium]